MIFKLEKLAEQKYRVTSETGIAALTLGRETGNADTNNSELRYGKVFQEHLIVQHNHLIY